MTIAPQFNPPASHRFALKSSSQRPSILHQLSSSPSSTYELLRSRPERLSFVINTLQTLHRCSVASISHQFMNLQTLGRKIGGIPCPAQSLFVSLSYELLQERVKGHRMRSRPSSHPFLIPILVR